MASIKAWFTGSLLVILGVFSAYAAEPAKPAEGPQKIIPGEIWPDDRGQHIQAHGGGILKYKDEYFWFGEDRSRDLNPNHRAVACYSSSDLVNWKFRARVFEMAITGEAKAPVTTRPAEFPGRGLVVERPKVFFNAKTQKFVMYMHLDGPGATGGNDYVQAKVGVAVCDTVDGNYTYVKSFRPLGQESRDIGQFVDDDGTAYLIFEDRPHGFHIAKLSEDYMTVEKDVVLVKAAMEGGAVVHYNGLYYMIGSALTGWSPNPNKYATATKLEGPWSEFKDIAPRNTNTYGSQSTMMLKVVGTKTTTVIFMADMWKPNTQWDSRYLWMPLEIGDGKLTLPEPREWTLDIKTGEAVINKEAKAMPYRVGRGG